MQAFSSHAQAAGKTVSSRVASLLFRARSRRRDRLGNCGAPGFNLIPTPGVIGPIPSEPFSSPTNNYTFFASDIALASHGYVEEEFYMKGMANAYDAPANTPATPPSTLANVVTPNIPYTTRITVRRPVDPARFNGTVLVEWFNVTDNFDGEYFWVQAQQDIVRQGYAYIGVSAQNNGIAANLGLKAFSPTRYNVLNVNARGGNCCTADRLSYDIFSQTAKAAYAAPAVMKGLTVKNVIGIGMSQSGSRLGVYTNYIHMRAPIFDAFLIQVATPAIRDDLPAPLIKVLSETEASSGNLNADQPDTALRKTYWIAGSNHGDQTQRMGRNAVRIRDLGLQNTPNDSCGPGGATPTRTRTPFRHVLNAAVFHLKQQIELGVQPPSGPGFVRASGSPNAGVLRDSLGNAVGAIRLAHMDVPTARANGTECALIGAWVPFTTAQLQALYPTHADYVAKVTAAVNASVAAGFVLPADAAEDDRRAEASVTGTGMECGLLCRSSSHYRADFSSTGLLRDNTVYLNIKNGGDLIAAVDAAHTFTAAGYSTTGAAAKDNFAKAAAELQRYLALVQTAQSQGRLTETGADGAVVAGAEHHRRSAAAVGVGSRSGIPCRMASPSTTHRPPR
jgi:hypothetical protein